MIASSSHSSFRLWRALPILLLLWLLAFLCHRGCSNSPWPAGLTADSDTLFLSYAAQIKTLDPTTVTYSHELAVTCNIAETPLGYHYLKRPYELIPLLLESLPEARYFDAAGHELSGDADASQVARCEYLLKLKHGLQYQPHPCFSGEQAKPLVRSPKRPADFGPAATREVTAEDLKTTLVRLCDPRLPTNVFSTFSTFIAGMQECSEAIAAQAAQLDSRRIAQGETTAQLEASPSLPDYRTIPLEGCQMIDRYTLKVILTRKYPQFLYWLAMPYTAPIPQEALDFYQRPDVQAAGLSFSLWPVGAGAYMLEECDPNSRIILVRNPNYRSIRYPDEGSAEDRSAGLLEDAGKALPLTGRVVYNFERESIPNWLKFQQGYYDNSGVPNDVFDSAIAFTPGSGELKLSEEMAVRGIRMTTTVPPISYYFAFNQLDPLLGGLSPQKCALRQALSIAIDTAEYVTIFKNGNGIAADGIIPPGIFGSAQPPRRMNTVLYRWDAENNCCVRRTLDEARALLAQAGYPGGIDPETGKPLVIFLDHADAGKPDFKNRFQWLSERFGALGIQLQERPTDLNRNREKLNNGNWQFLFEKGWVADYPDPENFLFLFYSANGRVISHGRGPNYSNYSSPDYDAIFKELETMPNSSQRLALIDKACALLAHDAPYCWDYHPVNTVLTHGWLHNTKPSGIANDTLKYLRVDAPLRARLQRQWNRPDWRVIYAIPAIATIGTLLMAIHAATRTRKGMDGSAEQERLRI